MPLMIWVDSKRGDKLTTVGLVCYVWLFFTDDLKVDLDSSSMTDLDLL